MKLQKNGCKLDVAISKKITSHDDPESSSGAITHDGFPIKKLDGMLSVFVLTYLEAFKCWSSVK